MLGSPPFSFLHKVAFSIRKSQNYLGRRKFINFPLLFLPLGSVCEGKKEGVNCVKQYEKKAASQYTHLADEQYTPKQHIHPYYALGTYQYSAIGHSTLPVSVKPVSTYHTCTRCVPRDAFVHQTNNTRVSSVIRMCSTWTA